LPVAGHLLFALRDKFGLDRVRNALPGSVASPGGAPGDGDGDGRKARDTALKHAKQEVARRVLLAVPEEPGYIDVDALFAAAPGTDGSTRTAGGAATTTTLPVKLEICSGSGDWVVAHAAADMHTGPGQPARARWLALELRCDRAHQTLCKSVAAHWEHCAQMPLPQLAGTGPSPFGGLPNLAILSGDATKVLPRRLAPASIAALYVNHPEPPERTSGEGESQGAHLLTQAFFGEMHRVLADDGTLTIVTDNLPYGESLLRAVAKTAHEVLTKRRRGGGDGAAFVSATLAEHATGARVLQEALTVSHDGVVGSGGKTKAAGGEGGTGAGKWAVKGYGKGKAGMKRKAAAAANTGIDSDDDDDDDDDGEDDDDAGASTAASASASPGSLRLELWRGDSEDGDTGAPASSSYFDRLWERGRKKRRWFMVLRKLP
jgi:tRNA G46 methylase TrmB